MRFREFNDYDYGVLLNVEGKARQAARNYLEFNSIRPGSVTVREIVGAIVGAISKNEAEGKKKGVRLSSNPLNIWRARQDSNPRPPGS